jgi:hypothetical protein
VPDEVTVDTGSPQDGSAEGSESGGAARSPKGGSEATDHKARIRELEAALARETGKAGSLKATLTDQLTAAITEAQAERAKVADLTKQIQHRDIVDGVLEKAPEKSRGAVRLAAMGILPTVDPTDPKAVETVIEKINAAAPELFAAKSDPIKHMPHSRGESSGRAGLAFTKDGKRLI